ncbi:MAG: thiamine pyrophosphate-dependent enzyme, partial [Pseudomonadota bacterium]
NAIRRNVDITLLVHDNKVYGLTKGQASPTSDMHMITKAQPHGVILEPFNPLAIALALKCGFVARGYAGNPEHLSLLIQQGVTHKGFSLIDILQPCVSFNHVNTYQWYSRRVYDLEKEGHDTSAYNNAMIKAQEWENGIPIGIFYKEDKPSYTDRIATLHAGPLIDRTYNPSALRTLLAELS